MTIRRALEIVVLLAAGIRPARAQGARPPAPAARAAALPALRAARDLARGVALQPGDIVADSSANAAAIDGWVTKRVVRQGEVLREPTIAPPQLIHAGSAVRVQASVDGVVVAREGIALGPGVLGERVRVRLDTQRTITGTVAGPATISLP